MYSKRVYRNISQEEKKNTEMIREGGYYTKLTCAKNLYNAVIFFKYNASNLGCLKKSFNIS